MTEQSRAAAVAAVHLDPGRFVSDEYTTIEREG